MELELQYKILDLTSVEVGLGRTINMSSTGVLFMAERRFAVGDLLELAIEWPLPLENGCPLKLITVGRVVRSEDARAAIAIGRYEFRLRGGIDPDRISGRGIRRVLRLADRPSMCRDGSALRGEITTATTERSA
jgi:hypothetical protein